MRKKITIFTIGILCSIMFMACGVDNQVADIEMAESTMESVQAMENVDGSVELIETVDVTVSGDVSEVPEAVVKSEQTTTSEETTSLKETLLSEEPMPIEEPTEAPVPESNGHLIVIDPGHQQKGNSEKEPIGPGAEETKAKVSGGTRGCVSGLAEYELTLQVGLKLQQELESRGYEVMMVRTTHDVNISNSERAQIANENQADAFIRIHADGYDDSSVHGATALCQTPQNPYNGSLYESSRALSEAVLEGVVTETGCKKRGVKETDTMSGINWCQVPVTIVEMGFMTNPEEDALLATEEYQQKLAKGMADGIDKFLAN